MFPDWVNNEINNNVEKQHKGLWRQNSLDWLTKIDTISPSGREPYHLQFSLQAASPETFGYILVCVQHASGSYFVRNLANIKSYLCNSTGQSPWETSRHSASQGIPRLLWKPKIYHRVHKSPPLDTTLRQMKPIHSYWHHFPNIYSNIIFPCKQR